jgi:flagellar biosynthesis component FlhA
MNSGQAAELYHYGIGRAQFAQGKLEAALDELSQVSGDSDSLRHWDYRTDLVFQLSSAQQIKNRQAYKMLRNWLIDQQAKARMRGDDRGVADAHAALLWLVRDHYWRLHRSDDEPDDSTSGESSPLELQAHPDLFDGGKSSAVVQRWSEHDLPRLVEQVRQKMGVILPTLLLRLDPSMRVGAYQVRVCGALAGDGQVRPDAMHCPAIDACHRLGLTGPTSPPAGDGRRGYWLVKPDLTEAKRYRLELRDPMTVIFEHLRSIVYRHLGRLVGFEEVQTLIDDWRQRTSTELVPEALRLTARVTLLKVLRSLLGEQVPITRLDIICAQLARVLMVNDDDKVLSHVRQGLISQLPGNDSGWNLIALPEEVEDVIGRSLTEPPGSGVLVLNEKVATRLSNLVRTTIEATPPPVAFVVARPELRRFTHRLLRARHLQVPVLASNELLSGRQARPPEFAHRHSTRR